MWLSNNARRSSVLLFVIYPLMACGPSQLEQELRKEYSSLEKRLTQIDTLREELQQRDEAIANLKRKLNQPSLAALPEEQGRDARQESAAPGIPEIARLREQLQQRDVLIDLSENKQDEENERLVLALAEQKRALNEAQEERQRLIGETATLKDQLKQRELDADSLPVKFNAEKQQLKVTLETQQRASKQLDMNLRQRSKEINDLHRQLNERDGEWVKVRAQWQESEKALTSLQAELTQAKQRAASIERKAASAVAKRKPEAETVAMQKRLKLSEATIADLRTEIKQAQEKNLALARQQLAVATKTKHSASAQTELDKITAETRQWRKQIEQRDATILVLQTKLKQKRAEPLRLALAEPLQEPSGAKTDVKQDKIEIGTLRDEVELRNQTIDVLNNTLSQTKQQLESVSSDQNDLLSQVRTATGEITRIQQDSADLKAQITAIERQRTKAQQELAAAKTKSDVLRSERDRLKKQLANALALLKVNVKLNEVTTTPQYSPAKVMPKESELAPASDLSDVRTPTQAKQEETKSDLVGKQELSAGAHGRKSEPVVQRAKEGGFNIESSKSESSESFDTNERAHHTDRISDGDKDNDIPWWYNTGRQ